MTTFDLVLLLVLANAVQNSINAGDNSLGGGLVSAMTLLVVNFVVAEAAYRWRRFERLVQGRPLTLVREGKVRAAEHEARAGDAGGAALGAAQAGDRRASPCCKHAVLESDGTLTAVRNDVVEHPLADLVEPQG